MLSNSNVTSLDLGINNMSAAQTHNLSAIIQRNIAYVEVSDLSKLQPSACYNLLPIDVMDDKHQQIIDQFNHTGNIQFDSAVIKVVGESKNDGATLEVTTAKIQVTYKNDAFISARSQFAVDITADSKVIQLATNPVTFGVTRPMTVLGPRLFYFTCASSHVVGLLAILRSLSPCATVQPPVDKLYELVLMEDSTFGLYTAMKNNERIGLKIVSKIPVTSGEYVRPPTSIQRKFLGPYIAINHVQYSPLPLIELDSPGAHSLAHLIGTEFANISWDLKTKFAIDIAKAMDSLHKISIIHGCLAPSDCLVVSMDPAANVNIKLADFGMARRILSHSVFAYNIIQWMAPEAADLEQYEKPADVYSYGVILWQLLTGEKNPYISFNYTDDNLVEHVIHGGRPAIPKVTPASPEERFVQIIEKCFGPPNTRPTFPAILVDLENLKNGPAPVHIDATQTSPTTSISNPNANPNTPVSQNLLVPADISQAEEELSEQEQERIQFQYPGVLGAWHITKRTQLPARNNKTWKKMRARGATSNIYLTRCSEGPVIVKEVDVEINNETKFLEHLQQVLSLDHPNIVKHFGACSSENPLIFMEYLPKGDLLSVLKDAQKRLMVSWEQHGHTIARDVISGIKFIHELNPPLVHCDIKTANILLDENWTAKICDLDTSRLQQTAFLSMRSSTNALHTINYSPPEILNHQPYTEKIDIYSFGVVLWELLTHKIPWEGYNPMQITTAILHRHESLPIPADVPDNLKVLLQRCMAFKPEDRPTAAEVLQALNELFENSFVAIQL